MNAEYGVDWKLKLFFHLLGNNQQLAFAQKIALLGFNRAVEKVLARAKIGNISVEKLAKLNPVPFRDQIEESIGPSVKSRGTVLYFTGCATHFIFENIGKAVVNVIRKLGFRLVVPKDQMCCAIPMFFSGELKKAKKNIEKNIEIFNRPEIVAVLVDCVSCESALNTYYESILQELKIDTTHARELAGKVKNISDFIFENLEYLRPFLKTKTKNLLSVTYHSPCHLRNNEKTSGKSEELLRQFSNIQYLKAKDTNSCCGGGGTFCFYHPQISQKIARNKLNNANETNAEYLATDCPSCRMNLNGNLETDDKIKLIHPVEVIDMFIEKRISADR
jgi:glycolate oxidase iron-sulfur subunit